jgi:hypothetical protein
MLHHGNALSGKLQGINVTKYDQTRANYIMEFLTKDTFLIYAIKNYQNPHCTSITDFDQDCKRFVVARTLMRNYYKRGTLPPHTFRLLLNHVVICTNMFGTEAAVKLFFYYCEEELWPCFVAIADHLSILPIDINIKPDPQFAKNLRS